MQASGLVKLYFSLKLSVLQDTFKRVTRCVVGAEENNYCTGGILQAQILPDFSVCRSPYNFQRQHMSRDGWGGSLESQL
jgi:hypothetical protein